MFASILQAEFVSVVLVQAAIWLFGTALIFSLFRYSQVGTEGSEPNPIVVLLASISGEPYDTLSSTDYSFEDEL